MKEAIGTSYVFTLIITFVGILIAMFVGSIAYTKGFKVRNKIIDLIDKHGGYTIEAQAEIDKNLAAIGYRIVDKDCPTKKGVSAVESGDYHYCVYEFKEKQKGVYYGVTVFIHIDIPLIGDFFDIPVYGETKLIFDKDYIIEK